MADRPQKSVEERVGEKIEALEAYIHGSEPSFEVPRGFGFNWFCELSEGGLEPFSKGSKSLRSGSVLHERIISAIERAEACRKKRSASTKKDIDLIKFYKAKVAECEKELDEIKDKLRIQIDENIDLRNELNQAKRGIAVEQALINDAKTEKGKSKVTPLTEGRG